ncbi:MAG: secretin and TonB N-terminal domain-containing protein [Candidatus Marinimicrobia bacterium]|nr:secretin and TonB N-terminal domain-containing protein [Candidatus Neomarinimicrobiota bacterium]
MKHRIILGCLIIIVGLSFSQTGTVSSSEAVNPTLVTVHAEDAHLPSILAVLAKESGYNIVTDPNVNKQDKISIHLDNVPIEQAINLVVRAVGLSYEIVGNSFLVADPKKLKEEVGVTSYVIKLKYSNAEEVKKLLSDLSNQIQVDVSGNKLLINASPKKIAEIEEVVKEIDVPALQITLETRLIEVAVDVEEELGIDWARLSSYTNIFAENAAPIVPGGGSIVPGASGLRQEPLSMPFNRLEWNKLNDQNFLPTKFSRQMTAFDVTLDFLMKNNKAEILADAKLTTLNGREASIEMLDIVPYILSSGGVGGQVQVQREEVGIKLFISPTVNMDGDITVKVEPEVSSIFDFIGPEKNIPRVKSRRSSTTIRVKDGESIVIGGLISRDLKETEYKVPVLNKIPFLGKKLFTSRASVERKTDLIIQITPRIVDDIGTLIMKTNDMINLENEVDQDFKIDDESIDNSDESTTDQKEN